jgi:hypothetical protein
MKPVIDDPLTPSWPARTRAFLVWFVGLTPRDERKPRSMAWADMKPIDFDGEDTSLTEADLGRLK